jgi:hypothetical protein
MLMRIILTSVMKGKASILSQAPVNHAHNPSYSGGRDQEDHRSMALSSNPSTANKQQKKSESSRMESPKQGAYERLVQVVPEMHL